MSSLAASRADGYYFPPDYDPAKHGSLNQFRGQHPLRERANKLDQGILVIRFEMPFNVWCLGCKHLIGKGVRFNADKKQIGNYYSTKIWSFTMRAPCCGQKIEVQTDPKNTEYIVTEGARRKVETWTAESAETIELPEAEEAQMAPRRDDTIFRLEKGQSDKARAKELNARVSELYHDSDQKFKNDYDLNKQLRRHNRGARKQEQELDKKRKSLGLSDSVRLLPESEQDSFAASLVQFGDPDAKWQQKRKAITSQSIFTPTALVNSWKGRRKEALEASKRPDILLRNDSARSEDRGLSQPELAQRLTSHDGDEPMEPHSAASSQTDDESARVLGRETDAAQPGDMAQRHTSTEAVAFSAAPEHSFASFSKGWRCPLEPISEDTEMDCAKDKDGMCHKKFLKRHHTDQGGMRKADKQACRLQLAAGRVGSVGKNLATCQQKLKKTSLTDKISAALRRR